MGRILCTDDDAESRELLRFMLEQAGHEVVCVGSGEEALSLARSQKFDLLVLDNWMPGLVGTELTRLFREFDQTTPIPFYSAAAYDTDKQAALDVGANAYLIKPNDIDDLMDEVDRLIKQST